MKSSRRRFLQTSTGILLGACSKPEKQPIDKESQPRTAEPARWEPVEELDTSLFPYPLRVGDVSHNSAILIIQTVVVKLHLKLIESGHTNCNKVTPQI